MDNIKEIYETIYGLKDINSQAIATGKSLWNGGMRNHAQATGSAIYYIIENLV